MIIAVYLTDATDANTHHNTFVASSPLNSKNISDLFSLVEINKG